MKGENGRTNGNYDNPLRPGVHPTDIYLFGLLDEGKKVPFLVTLRGTGEFSLSLDRPSLQVPIEPWVTGLGGGLLKNARDVQYLPPRWCVASPSRDLSGVTNHMRIACSAADCTTLYYGGSCNGIGMKGDISYAFNSYYQMQKQDSQSCEFDGLGMVTVLDPSIGDCRFLVGISDNSYLSSGGSLLRHRFLVWVHAIVGSVLFENFGFSVMLKWFLKREGFCDVPPSPY